MCDGEERINKDRKKCNERVTAGNWEHPCLYQTSPLCEMIEGINMIYVKHVWEPLSTLATFLLRKSISNRFSGVERSLDLVLGLVRITGLVTLPTVSHVSLDSSRGFVLNLSRRYYVGKRQHLDNSYTSAAVFQKHKNMSDGSVLRSRKSLIDCHTEMFAEECGTEIQKCLKTWLWSNWFLFWMSQCQTKQRRADLQELLLAFVSGKDRSPPLQSTTTATCPTKRGQQVRLFSPIDFTKAWDGETQAPL